MRRTEAKSSAGSKSSANFESSLTALEKIVRELERGDLPLERSLELFEQGVRLSRECQERLSQAERRIEILMRDAKGEPVIGAFDDEELDLTAQREATESDESVF